MCVVLGNKETRTLCSLSRVLLFSSHAQHQTARLCAFSLRTLASLSPASGFRFHTGLVLLTAALLVSCSTWDVVRVQSDGEEETWSL